MWEERHALAVDFFLNDFHVNVAYQILSFHWAQWRVELEMHTHTHAPQTPAWLYWNQIKSDSARLVYIQYTISEGCRGLIMYVLMWKNMS